MKYPPKYTAVLIIVALLFYSCKLKPNPGWIKDKNGCLGIRNQKLAKALIDQYDLMGDTESDFIKVFGLPDTTDNQYDKHILIYYWGGICENSKPTKEADKCYAQFYFKDEKLSSADFTCE